MSAGSPLWSGGMMPAIFIVEGLLIAFAVTLIAQPASDALRRWCPGVIASAPALQHF